MPRLPPGFRFHPTDVELIMYYLKRKIMGKILHFEGITELNMYKFSPWDLPDKCCYKSKDLEWYFFCPRERKCASGVKMNRATEDTGKLLEKIDLLLATKRLFGIGKGNATQDSYVLCKVFQKSGPGPKNGAQYGAPFKEEDWEDDKILTEPCTSDVFPVPPGRPDNQSNSIVTGVVEPGSTSGWPSSEQSLSPIQPSIQRLPLDEPDDDEFSGEPNPSNVSSINWMSSDKLDDEGGPGPSNPSNIFSALPILPEKQSYSVGTSMVNPGPGPSNAQMCNNEMPLDEQDDEIIGLLAHFTEDATLLSAGNETNQNLENFNQDVSATPAPFTDGNDIFDGIGDIEYWAGLGQSRSDLSASGGVNYSLNPMILPEDAAYMELNDLEIPFNHSAETFGTGQSVLGNFWVQQTKYYLSIFALCDGSFILVKAEAEVTLGVDGCTNDALSVILGEQRKVYSSIFALCGSSFKLVKAEVTLGFDGCTNEALSVILGDRSCTSTCGSNVG
ncbi:hypothetical protein RND71_009266 [Anisodus tanguticus]|uniref:NAC domain-containing protein n=1 Tax=Anisodus tanguticus TaxID=243964 RepID=A0AAE1VMS0_9SOLA|nr:hypothetical protein RND71_009266 [Anisodus tanguticus]